MPIDYEELFRQKFSRVHLEIDSIQDMLLLKKGAWIFTRHVYSKEDLFRLPQFRKLHTICRKIGSDVIAWNEANSFPEDGREAYRNARARVARSLTKLRKAIQDRKPTALEKLLEFFDGFVAVINDLLPTLAKLIRIGTKLLAAKAAPLLLIEGGTDLRQ